MNGNSIKIGDTIQYKGCFGLDDPSPATVIAITLTEYPGDKYGDEVTEVSQGIVRQDRALFSLDNHHWCYGRQVQL